MHHRHLTSLHSTRSGEEKKKDDKSEHAKERVDYERKKGQQVMQLREAKLHNKKHDNRVLDEEKQERNPLFDDAD